jgi:hypothetical protein
MRGSGVLRRQRRVTVAGVELVRVDGIARRLQGRLVCSPPGFAVTGTVPVG